MSQVILILEDDPLVAMATEEACRKGGFAPRIMTAEEGLTVVADPANVHAIVLDINMPKVDGIEFIRRMPETAIAGKVPIILVSGADEAIVRATRTLADLHGANVVEGFRKPFDLNKLISVLTNLQPRA